jgi:hypothetical protein
MASNENVKPFDSHRPAKRVTKSTGGGRLSAGRRPPVWLVRSPDDLLNEMRGLSRRYRQTHTSACAP